RWALAGEDVLTRELEALNEELQERVADDPARVLEGFELSDSDRAQLDRPEVQQVVTEAMAEPSAHGVGGWVDDELAWLGTRGLDVASISIPVLVVYGSADVLVPAAHGNWLAGNVPGCVVKIDDAGHLGADPEQEFVENLHWLRDGTPPDGSRPGD